MLVNVRGEIYTDAALHLGLPPVNPWLDSELEFEHGANYAIPGATTLPSSLAPLEYPLSKQVAWHLELVHDVLLNDSDTTYKYTESSLAA
jgi:hypothetical protein